MSVSEIKSPTFPYKYGSLVSLSCLFMTTGIPIRTTLDNGTTVQYACLITQLAQKARNFVRDLDPQNDLTFLRVRSKKNEIMVAPGNVCILRSTFVLCFLAPLAVGQRAYVMARCPSCVRPSVSASVRPSVR